MGKKILIIGNGFDLYHQLPTRYTDFLYLAKEWSQFMEEDYARNADVWSAEHIEYLDEHLQKNKWIKYFLQLENRGKGWIDFEKDLEFALQVVEKYYQWIPTQEGKVPIQSMSVAVHSIDQIFEPYKIPGYTDLNYKVFHKNEVEQSTLVKNKKLLLNLMKEELDILNRCLNYYMIEFVDKKSCSLYSQQIRELSDIYLLNFNYTHTFEKVYGKAHLLDQHMIHGDVCKENIVLGIEDDAFEGTLDYVYFQKYFQRIQRRTGNLYKKWLNGGTKESEGTTQREEKQNGKSKKGIAVFIMGHSLSKVDYGVLKDFFEEDQVEKITIYYHSQSAYEKMIINLVDMFGKDFVIDQTYSERIIFEKILPGIESFGNEERT